MRHPISKNCNQSEEPSSSSGNGMDTLGGGTVYHFNFYEDQKHGNYLASYKYDFNIMIIDIQSAVDEISGHLYSMIKPLLKTQRIKVKLTIALLLERKSDSFFTIKKLPSDSVVCLNKGEYRSTIQSCVDSASQLAQISILKPISDTSISAVVSIKVNIVEHTNSQILRVGYLPLPTALSSRLGLASAGENSEACLLYTILLGLCLSGVNEPIKVNSKEKAREIAKIVRRLNGPRTWSFLIKKYHLQLTNIDLDENLFDIFECVNNISLGILKLSKTAGGIFPYRLTKRMCEKHVWLLLVRNRDLCKRDRKKHTAAFSFYCIYSMQDFLRLLHKPFISVCRFCGMYYRTSTHEENCFNSQANNSSQISLRVLADRLKYAQNNKIQNQFPHGYDIKCYSASKNDSSLVKSCFDYAGLSFELSVSRDETFFILVSISKQLSHKNSLVLTENKNGFSISLLLDKKWLVKRGVLTDRTSKMFIWLLYRLLDFSVNNKLMIR